ncbi:MAG: hypothetical protein V9G20_01435 [Candidatus Promineifilaceae bacterium]
MPPTTNKPQALFIAPDGQLYPDSLVCSGTATQLLAGEPCPYAQNGGMPDPVPLCVNDVDYSPDKGQPGDLCPPCAKQNLSSLGHWQGHGGQTHPEALFSLRLFKCRQWLWLVVPGLHEADPTQIVLDD